MRFVAMLAVVICLSGCTAMTATTVLWTQTYGGAARDVGGSIAAAPDGGWLIAGTTRSFSDGQDAVWLLRLDAKGEAIWTRTIEAAPLGMRTATMSLARAEHGWVVGAQRRDEGNNHDIVIIAIDPDGRELWTRTHDGGGYDHFEVIRATPDGGYIIGGGTTPEGYAHDVPWVIRTDASGNVLWRRVFPGPGYGHAEAIVDGTDGGFVVAFGYDDRPGEYPIDTRVSKLDDEGETVWTWTYGGPEIHVWPEWIESLEDGGYIVAGAICEPCSPRQPNYDTHFDAFVARLTRDGDTVWTRRVGGDANDLAYFLTVTSRGTYLVSGATTPPGGPADSPWLVELDPSGDTVWSHVFDSPFPRNGVAQVREVATDEFLATGPPWLYQRDGVQDLWVLRLRRTRP